MAGGRGQRLRGRATSRRDKDMAGIYRSLYYADVTVGSGGRLTIPQEIREDLGIEDGNTLTLRVEESPDGQRQMVIWKAAQQTEE
jgi:AbrB family looped-hinge helix DNA binding protein